MSLSLHDLEKGRRIAALVVRHCGEKYFPLFDREVRERASAADRIEDAIGANMPARPRKRGRS